MKHRSGKEKNKSPELKKNLNPSSFSREIFNTLGGDETKEIYFNNNLTKHTEAELLLNPPYEGKLNFDTNESKLINYITLELTRNARHYNSPYEEGEYKDFKPSISLRHSDTHLYIQSENLCKNYFVQDGETINAIDQLVNSISDLNKLSHEQLQKEYKHKGRNANRTRKGGAGLGFLDIGKKLKKRVHHIDDIFEIRILKVTDDISHVILRAKVPLQF